MSKKEKNETSSKSDRISEIYKDQEVTLKKDMTQLDRKASGRFSWTIVMIIIFLALIATATVVGFFVFNSSRDNMGNGDIELSVDAPAKVASGEEITININYTNAGKVDIDEVGVSMQYPDSFYYKSSSMTPSAEFENYWDIGEIKAGKDGELQITGRLIGEVGTAKNFKVTFIYQPENFSYDFEKEKEIDILINSSTLSLDIDAPTKAVDGQEIEYLAKLTNTSDDALDDIKLIIEFPNDFEVTSAEPSVSQSNNIWLFDSLDAEEETEVKLRGSLHGNKGDMKGFKIQTGVLDEDGVFVLQQEENNLIQIVEPEFDLSLFVNGKSDNFNVSPGDTLEYKVICENNSDLLMKNISLSLEFTQEAASGSFAILDFTSLEDSNNGELAGQKIIWTSQGESELASLAPGEKVELTVSIDVRDEFGVKNSDDKDLVIKGVAKVESYTAKGLEEAEMALSEDTLEVKIKTEAETSAKGLYYDDKLNKVGSGPHPPEVGETTSYQIIWQINNTTNDLEDVKMIGILPEGVSWYSESTVSMGDDLEYDPVTKKVEWNLDKIIANSGELFSSAQAIFKVSIEPEAADVGEVITLLKDIALTSTDSFTRAAVTAQDNKITTKLEDDDLAAGTGKVVK